MIDLNTLQRHTLWTDRATASGHLQALLDAQAIDAGQAQRLNAFIQQGWLNLKQAVPPALLNRAWIELDEVLRRGEVMRAHREGVGVFGTDQAASLGIEPGRFAVLDLHNRSGAALQAVSHEGFMPWVAHLLDEAPVLMQSQWFRFGSAKGTHADYVYYPIEQPLVTLTVWIAIDQVDGDNGPLYVVPGSHRLPAHVFDQGQLLWPHGEDLQQMRDYHAAMDAACTAWGLAPVALPAEPGDVLLLHPRLAHGACVAADPGRSRRSLVLHLAAPQAYRSDHRPWAAGSSLCQSGRLRYHQPNGVQVDA